MSTLFVLPRQVPLSTSGELLSGAKLYFYATGTTTPQNTYTTSALSTAHANPVIADGNGVFPAIYLDPALLYKTTLTTAADVLMYTVDPVNSQLTQSAVGAVLYPQTDSELAAAITPASLAYPPGNVLRYGADPTGVANSQIALHDAQLQAQQDGGADIVIPPGTYSMTSQWVITGPAFRLVNVMGFGATITTTGSISGVAVTGGSTTGGVVIWGLKVNHRGNASATAGFDFYNARNCAAIDCWVEAHGVSASYAAFRARQSDTGDTSTGVYWLRLNRCRVRKRSLGDSGDITYGLQIRGAANALMATDCTFSTCTTAIHHTIESGQTYLANGCSFIGNAIESCTTGYHCEGATTSSILGPQFIANRFEALTTAYSWTVTTTQPAVAPFLMGNQYITITTYINNPNSLRINALDFSETPNLRQPVDLYIEGGLAVHGLGGSSHGLKVTPGGANRGLHLTDASGTEVAALEHTSSTMARLRGVSAGLTLQELAALYFGSTSATSITRGAGSPEGAVTAPVGSLYLRTDGGANTSVYVKESGSGNTGWVGK